MTGGSDRHEEIALNLAAALRGHLRGTGCRAYKSDLKIRVADDFYYPDVFVRCSDQRNDPYFKTNPALVAEVLSPSTQRYDRGDKHLAYFSLGTLEEYVLIAQDKMYIEIYRRGNRDFIEKLDQAESILRLESVDFALTLSDLYA